MKVTEKPQSHLPHKPNPSASSTLHLRQYLVTASHLISKVNTLYKSSFSLSILLYYVCIQYVIYKYTFLI